MKSSRQPFVRAGLMGLVPLLLPFVWVLELDSCGHAPVATQLTGLELVGKFNGDAWAITIPALLLCVGTPFLAARLAAPGWRLVVHLAGLVAAGFSAYAAAIVMFFTIFSSRSARGVGWLVVALFVGSLLDALLRVFWSVRELVVHRRESSARANL